MPTIATREPTKIIAGDTVTFTKKLSEYLPADGWVLTYGLVKPGTDLIKWTATDNGDGQHLINILAETSIDYVHGDYRWQSYVTKAAERYSIATGGLIVKANFADASSGFDDRAHCEKVLDSIEAVIENRATKDQESYSISGRSLSRTPITDLLVLRDKYRIEVKRLKDGEKLRKGLGGKNQILTRFT